MLVISWNVAGLSPLTKLIHESYSPARDTKQGGNAKASFAALQEFMRRHGADIFCLQEHKIPLSQLSNRSEPRRCSNVEGYESFWSCCVDKRKQGFNGVVTYARKGTVQSADASPLGSKDLDEQGRCIMTDHGSFVLFNVYVPAGGGQPLEYKMKFLEALRSAMQQQRKRKPVMLVGDLNIKHTALDVCWKRRVVDIDAVRKQVASSTNVAELPQWKRQLAQSWDKIVATMKTKEVVAKQTTNTQTGKKFDKFRLAVTVDGNHRVYLGKHEKSKAFCLYYYTFGDDSETGGVVPEVDEGDSGDEECDAGGSNEVPVFVLTELMAKIAGVNWNLSTQRMIARTDAGIRRDEPPRQWLVSVMEEDGMVDTFRHFYPTAEGRFTCWAQDTNRRYENEGVRLDYMLVDASLMQHVLKGDVPTLRCGTELDDPLGEHAALCAATANGAFKPVSFAGEGIQEATQDALDTQFGSPHTGIIYTPPSFSDHVGVSLLLDEACCQRDLNLKERDTATQKSQPHKKQQSITSFFSKPTGGRPKSSESLAKKFETATTKKKNESKGLKGYFPPRKQSNKSESQGNGVAKRQKLGPSNSQEGQKEKRTILDLLRK